MNRATTTVADIAAFNRGMVQAMMTSSNIWMTGCQTLSHAMVSSTHAQFEHAVTAWTAIGRATSTKEAMDLHAGLARGTVEKAVLDGGNLAHATMTLVEQTAAPLTEQAIVAANRIAAQFHPPKATPAVAGVSGVTPSKIIMP